MKTLTKAAWDRVIEKACEVANATRSDEGPTYDIYRQQMLDLLNEIEAEFGTQSRILDTRADYTDDPLERRLLRTKALKLARAMNDPEEIELISQSLRELEEEPGA